MVAVSCRTDRTPADIIFGFGAHLDARIALLRAITEMNQVLPAVRPLSPENQDPYSITDPLLIRWFSTATLESEPYLAPDPSARTRTLADYPVLSTHDLQEDLLRIARMLRDKGMETLVLDQTRPDTGLHVARVVVPGLRHFRARFAPGRLYEVPVFMGWLARPLSEEELNPTPMFI